MVAGGSGRRFGGPKQYLHLAGRPVAAWSVDAARSASDGVVLVVPADDLRPGGADGRGGSPVRDLGADRIVAGGATRSDSVRAGLAAVPADADIIVVHDAARPLAGPALFSAVVDAVRSGGADGAIPVVPVADTLKRVADGWVRETVDREGLVSVQPSWPQRCGRPTGAPGRAPTTPACSSGWALRCARWTATRGMSS